MSIALRPGSRPAESWRHDALPLEIGFLRKCGVSDAVLRAACVAAQRQGVEPLEALLASGGVTDTLYYRSLAYHLDLKFRWDRANIDPRANGLRALREGQIALADGTILVAPTVPAVRLLLMAAIRHQTIPRRLAIATPRHFERLVLLGDGPALARRASDALPALEPGLSAHGALDCRARLIGTGVLVMMGIMFQTVPALFAGLVSVLFLLAIGFRTIASVAGATAGFARRMPSLIDAALPSYSVLVPLFQEAGMVEGLVRHLATLDYPAAKLEILLLAEDDDIETLAALAATRKPASMRTVVVPPGRLRTKPRALNLGLILARGDLITVFDAEDRPECGQLRAAAACFAVAPSDVACLQGRLAITEGNLLQRLFAVEYAALFDVYNVGLARLGLPVPLGGTSNHFRSIM